MLSLPVYVHDNTLLALGNNDQRLDYTWYGGTAFRPFHLKNGRETRCNVPTAGGSTISTLKARHQSNTITVNGGGEARDWTLCLHNIPRVTGMQGGIQASSEWDIVVDAEGNMLMVTLQNAISTAATLSASGEGPFTSFSYKKQRSFHSGGSGRRRYHRTVLAYSVVERSPPWTQKISLVM